MKKELNNSIPIQKFVKIESLSGILLFSATIIALIWANSSFSDSYFNLWNFKLGFTSDAFYLNKPLLLWVNDGLMAIFFFLIGLEIKRELMIGELNSIKKASFPFLSAIGGMLVPMFIYMTFATEDQIASGWGIPMATDIAFSLAILRLLGDRVPLALKVFLTAFAIVDDLGAVIVIAIFYSSGVKFTLLIYAAVLLSVLFFLASRGIYIKYLIFGFGIIIWFLFLKAGIHPTIAGVLLAFTVPVYQKIGMKTYTETLDEIVNKIRSASDNDIGILTKEQIVEIDNLEDWTSQVQSPLQHLEHALHNWVSYLIMPVFALANAGVALSFSSDINMTLVYTIPLALIFGNVIGLLVMSFLATKLKITELPEGVGFKQLLGVGFLAGVGFTMSIFIAGIAFADNQVVLDSAKIGILLGSFVSGFIGFVILRFSTKTKS